MSEEKQMPDNVDTIEDLVKHSLAQDYNKANEVFGNYNCWYFNFLI